MIHVVYYYYIVMYYLCMIYGSTYVMCRLRFCSIRFYLQHWFVSGNVQCFHNWHAPLGVLAIFTLIFCVSIIVIIVIYALQWMEVSYCVAWVLELILNTLLNISIIHSSSVLFTLVSFLKILIESSLDSIRCHSTK